MKLVPIRAVVTGASSGIGQRIAIELARQFAGDSSRQSKTRIVVHYRQNLDGASETARSIQQLGVEAEVIQADLRESADRRRLIDRSWSFLEQPTTWINNAGADVLTGDATKLDFSSKLRLLLEVDVLSTIALSRDVIKRLMADRSLPGKTTGPGEHERGLPPSLTFIGWDQAPHGMEGDAGQMFGPVKAAVMAFANSLAQEVAPRIRVNTIAPGWIRTAWGENTDSYWDDRATAQSLMNRWGTPADVAKAACFLADPTNTFCSGQTLCVNGGWDRNRSTALMLAS